MRSPLGPVGRRMRQGSDHISYDCNAVPGNATSVGVVFA
jgi:hypothetical protein